jgi:hypothetical protein
MDGGDVCIVVAFPVGKRAHDTTQQHAEWFNKQEINPAARERMGVPYKSCCDAGDVYKTRFRVGLDNSDQWQYQKDGVWTKTRPIASRSSSSTGTPASNSDSSFHEGARDVRNALCDRVPQPRR